MIKVVGVSHVSEQSIERIDEAFESFQPDVVCLELDSGRFNALMSDQRVEPQSLTHRALAGIQRYIGRKTGVMPGEEMLHAYEKASDAEQVYLIDRDIRITLQRLKSVRRKEKAKALLMVPFSFFGGPDLDKIPEEEELEEMKEEFRKHLPGIYQVLLEERDEYMAQAVEKVVEENPESRILVVVGAAHERGIKERIDGISGQSPVEEEER